MRQVVPVTSQHRKVIVGGAVGYLGTVNTINLQQIYMLLLSSLTLCPKAVLPLLSFLFRNLSHLPIHSSLSGSSSWFFLSSNQEDDTGNV